MIFDNKLGSKAISRTTSELMEQVRAISEQFSQASSLATVASMHKDTLESFRRPYGYESVIEQARAISEQFSQASSLATVASMHKDTLESFRRPYGYESVIEQARAISEQFSQASSLATVASMHKDTLESFRKPYGYESVIEQARAISEQFSQADSLKTLSNMYENSNNLEDIFTKLIRIDISEAIQIHNELNNTLKPYSSYNDLSSSNISWFSLDEVRRVVIEAITLYMLIMYFLNPVLERKDLGEYNGKQQLWLKEEFKKQTKELNNLYIQKDKELYYITVRDNIVLRSNPYIKKSTVKSRLDKGTNLLVLLRKDNWLNVEYFDETKQVTQVGWVHIKNLKRVREIK